jgi:predicted ATPase
VITAIQIRNYKGIKSIPWLDLGQFHVLVGPNGSGKSTFLDAIEFVKDCVTEGPLRAVERRVPDFLDLTFRRKGGPIELGLRLEVAQARDLKADTLEYSLVISRDDRTGVAVKDEVLSHTDSGEHRRERRILGKTQTGNDFYRRESGTYTDSFQFGPTKLALSLTPPDVQRYPTGNAVKEFLSRGVRFVQLDSVAMRQPAAATRPSELELDGTNLPRVVGNMLRIHPGPVPSAPEKSAISRWTEHLRYALEDLESIGWAARKPDNAEYLILKFKGGLECPNWLLSDGILRMLALTVPAFLPSSQSVYMVEEPENGVHPYALEIILKALAAIPEAQVFVATHSPLVVQQAGVKALLCFTRNEKRGVSIIHGSNHPALRQWKGSPDLASIFESRVLG